MSQEVSGETVLLDLKTERYLGLNEVGTNIWKLLQQGKDLETIRKHLLKTYDVDADTLASDLDQLISDMVSNKIITLSEHSPV